METMKVIFFSDVITHFDEGASKYIEKVKTIYSLDNKIVYISYGTYNVQTNNLVYFNQNDVIFIKIKI
jgi:hypothetical protein